MIWAMAKNRIPINDATVKELYGRNGYKAAFSKKCINSACKIDDIMGHDESQLAVFNPKDIDIKSPLDVTVRELLENQKLKVQGKINGVKFSLNSFKKVCELVKDNFNRKYKQA